MNRRTWFRTLTGALATLATGLGLRKVEKPKVISPKSISIDHMWTPKDLVGLTSWVHYEVWKDAYSRAYYDGQRWHFEDVKTDEE